MPTRSHAIALAVLSSIVTLSAVTLSIVLTAPPDARAQDDEGGGEAAPAEPSGPPTTTGRAEAQAAVGQAGMIFELHSKARLVVPPRLPIGSSRRMRFAEERAGFVPARVADGFRRLGPVLAFDGAINATSAPVVVSIRQPSDPSRPSLRVVLAMETPMICREGLEPLRGAAGLCSHWELLDARYDASERRLTAQLPTPGGYRLVFGTVPIPPPAEPAPTADDEL